MCANLKTPLKKRKWNIFKKDAEWIDLRAKSENGHIVESIESLNMERASFFVSK